MIYPPRLSKAWSISKSGTCGLSGAWRGYGNGTWHGNMSRYGDRPGYWYGYWYGVESMSRSKSGSVSVSICQSGYKS